MDPTLPTAGEIQPYETLDVLASQIKVEHAATERSVRDALLRAKKIGEMLLQAKSRCGHGQWMEWMKRSLPFGQTMCARYMRIAGNFSKLAPSANLTESLRVLAEAPEEEPAKEPPPREKRFCERCQRVGPIRDCPDCLAARRKPVYEREPGDDTEAEAAAEEEERQARRTERQKGPNGQQVVDIAKLREAFRLLIRLPDKVYQANGRTRKDGSVKEDPMLQGLLRISMEWRDAFWKMYKEVAGESLPRWELDP